MEQLALALDLDGLPDPLAADPYKTALQRLTPLALNALRRLLENPKTPPHVLASVAQTVIHTAYGKPRQEVEHTGADSTPLQVVIRSFADA